MITLDFYLKWGSMYQINSFGCPTEEIMFIGRSNGFIICCSESGLHVDWLKKGFATQIPSAMAEYVYMLPESVFYPKNRDQYPEHIHKSSNFETVDQMISFGLINDRNMCASLAYLWNVDETSAETKALKWFLDKIISVNDFKFKEQNITVLTMIVERMMKKENVKRYIIDLYIAYMSIIAVKMLENAEYRVKSILSMQVSDLPF